MIIVTTNDVPGYRVDAVLGEVMGMTVRSVNIVGGFTAGLRSIGGGEIPEFRKIAYESRHEVMQRMVAEAEQRGANAVIAMRFDAGEIGQSFTEICAYGTAVYVSPIAEGETGATLQSVDHAKQLKAQQYQQPQPAAQDQGYAQPSPYGQQPTTGSQPTYQQPSTGSQPTYQQPDTGSQPSYLPPEGQR